MFTNKQPQKKNLTDILGMFYTAQEELTEFMETKQVEKEAVEAKLSNITKDLTKGESTLKALDKMLN